MAKNIETLGIRMCIIGLILLIIGILAYHPQSVLETVVDDTIFLASVFFLIPGVAAIIKGRRKAK